MSKTYAIRAQNLTKNFGDILAVDKDGTYTENHGLAVMRERAESIGGTVEVISSPRKGTEIKIEIPITNGVHSDAL